MPVWQDEAKAELNKVRRAMRDTNWTLVMNGGDRMGDIGYPMLGLLNDYMVRFPVLHPSQNKPQPGELVHIPQQAGDYQWGKVLEMTYEEHLQVSFAEVEDPATGAPRRAGAGE